MALNAGYVAFGTSSRRRCSALAVACRDKTRCSTAKSRCIFACCARSSLPALAFRIRPTQLMRIVEPIEGTPRISVVCQPRLGWSKVRPVVLQGSHHVRFEGFASQLRLTSDIPNSYLGGQPFTLTGRHHLVLSWGAPVEEPLAPLCERFWNETARYWQYW